MFDLVLVLMAIVVIVVVVAARRPDEFSVTRSCTITASAAEVFNQVNDLSKWQAWSPWAKLDPHAKNVFEGPIAGIGAVMRWEGNNQVGAGSMTITESRPNEFIQFKLDFLKPFTASNTAEFTFVNLGNQTEVTWIMRGTNNLLAKIIVLFMNCDKMVGGQFEQGLRDLRALVE